MHNSTRTFPFCDRYRGTAAAAVPRLLRPPCVAAAAGPAAGRERVLGCRLLGGGGIGDVGLNVLPQLTGGGSLPEGRPQSADAPRAEGGTLQDGGAPSDWNGVAKGGGELVIGWCGGGVCVGGETNRELRRLGRRRDPRRRQVNHRLPTNGPPQMG